MDNHLTIRVPKRLIKASLVLALVAAVISPIAVSASHTFSDVPDESIFHEDISWLADANVTKGCNPPANDNFCPKDNVTREQMAAFMRRLAEGQVVDAATAITAETAAFADNAGTVDNYEANELNRVTFDVDEVGDPVTVVGLVDLETIMSVEITAPRGGYITIAGQVGLVRDADAVGGAICMVAVDDIDGNPGADILDGSRNNYTDSVNAIHDCSSHAAFATWFGGTYTVNFDVGVIIDSVDVDEGTLIVQYTPFNGEGGVPFGVIVLPPIITLGEIAEDLAATDPDIAARLPEIMAAIG